MQIVAGPLTAFPSDLPLIRLQVDRLTLSKRRWRGVAEDGAEFGFDLETPLTNGAALWKSEAGVYVIAQRYEPVLEIPLRANAAIAARLGWMIGNLHFQIEVTDNVIRVAEDPALRQLFARESVEFTACKRVFHPLSGGHKH